MSSDISAFEYLRQKARKTGSLLSIHLDITYRCPLKCIHCYIDHRENRELSITEITKVLKDARRLNAVFITYSGGEVFVREDFEDILKISYKLNYVIKIITSGYLISDYEVEMLKRYNVTSVGVSLYAVDPEIHDRITGVRGSFNRTIRAIELLKNAKINVVVKTSIMRPNYKDYLNLLRWIKSQGRRVSAQYDMVITPTKCNRSGVRDLNIPYKKKRSLLSEIKRIEAKRETKIEDMDDYNQQYRVSEDSITCYAGITGIYIAPNGKVFPCVEWDELLGDLRKESLIEIWKNSERLMQIRNLRIKDYKKCVSCKYLSACSICPGLNLRDKKDIFEPSDLACQRARMYYEQEKTS
ncbi:MAG: radical SAM protein [Deltaproteobacteria bacterium]|nr:radical SAM protein [Deltaproteobacteria bacterium]